MSGDELTALESSFVWFEQPGRPIHVGAVASFEGGPLLDRRGRLRLGAVRAHVAGRLERVPRLRQRIAPGASALARPRWVDDPAFDVAHHVDEVRLPPPGDDAAFHELAQQVHAELFDPAHPPWQMRFVTGRADGRVGLIERAHHALVDGVGGVDVAVLFFDLERDPPATAPTLAEIAPAPSAGGNGWDGWPARWLRGPADAVGAAASAVRHPLATGRAAGDLVRGLATVVADGVVTPGGSLTVAPGPHRRLAWLRVGLGSVKDAGHAAGATVNDVMLAAVTTGLRALLVERGVPLPHDLTLKALVPVSERDAEAVPTLGNQVSAVLAPLPVGLGDPAGRLAAVMASMRRLKASTEAGTVGALLRGADLLPAPVAQAVVRRFEHQPFINLVVTNVPGPPCRLYLMGAELLEAFPVVPLGANLSVGVAILSYDDVLHIGITADADACGDVDVFARGIAEGFRGLGVE